MEGVSIEDVRHGTNIRKVALASFIGTAIEWYDFYIYGVAAALVFPKLFFPRFSPLAGTLASFATFGVAFIARPIGGIVFGHFGDRIGRQGNANNHACPDGRSDVFGRAAADVPAGG